jgi:hypothetical protein
MSDSHTSGWGTQHGSGRSPEYSRGQFLIYSTNKFDHSTSVRPFGRKEAVDGELPETLTLPVEAVAQMHQMVSDPRTPYRSIQDLIRDSIHHRLHDLTEMMEDGDYEEFFNAELYKQALIRQLREDQSFTEQMDFFDGVVKMYVEEGDPHGVADVLRMWRERRPPLRLMRKWLEATARWERQQERAEAK